MTLSLLLAFLQAAGGAPEPRWHEPSEVHRVDGLVDIYGPSDVFRTRNGHVGVFVYLQADDKSELYLRVSPGDRGPWTDVPLHRSWAGVLQVDGDEVELLGFDDKAQGMIRWRVALADGKSRELWRKKLSPPGGQRLQHVAADDGMVWALLTDANDFRQLSFSRSTDGGTTWIEPTSFGRTAHRGPLYYSTNLLRTERGLHVVLVADEGVIYRSSQDGGKTWAKADLAIPPDLGTPGSVVGFAEGRTIHLVLTARVPNAPANILHVASRDEGRTWEVAQGILKGPIGVDLAPFYALRGSGGVLAFTATDNNQARLVVSRDGGRTWKESNLREGLQGGTGLAATWVDPGGALRSAVMVDHRKRRGVPAHVQWVLLRTWDAPPGPPAPLEGKARDAALALIRQLGDDDFAAREAAVAGLRKLGADGHLLFREEMERTNDLQIKDSLKRLLPQPLRAEWWSPR